MDLSAGQDLGGGDAADWRTLLPEGSRRRSVDKIMDTMKRLLPFSGEEGIQEHMKMAVRFEEKTYTAAASQSDYSRKIYLEMLKLERESQNPPANSYPFNAASYNQSRQYPDSSSQTGNANGGDWQEEIFQKIRSMNDMYFPELNEMYQKIAAKLQKHDSLPQQPKNDPLEKLRFFKVMLERLIMFLRISKNEVQHYHKEKIIAVEKQIINILNSNKPRQPVSSILQGQLSQPHLHTTQHSLQPQSQISKMHPHENQKNSQMQPVNAQDCMTAAQPNNVTNLQNNYSSSVSGVSSEPDHVGALRMMTMETRSQNPTANSVQFNAAGNTSQNTHDPASLDSSSQTGNANDGDWKEEIFQKIRSMNDMYFPELNEMYQKMAAKLQKHDSLPQQPKNDPLEKLRFFKVMLERLILFLRISKNEVQHYHKEKIIAVEKQIINIVNSNKPRLPVSSILQGQLSQPHLHTTQQSLQPQSQISQMHPHENQKNSQMQPVNAQACMTAAQQNNVTNLQNNSSSSVSGVSSEPDHVGALRMMTMETRSQNPTANSVQFNAAGNTSQNTHDPVL